MIKHLYFIGNGFDIHHGIPSRYSDFLEWLIENDSDIPERIGSIYGWADKEWWSDFENNLGEFEIEEFTKTIYVEHAPDYGSDKFREADRYEAEIAIEDKLGKLYNDIRKSFKKWVLHFPNAEVNKKIELNLQNAYFVNFNYTDTLKVLYQVQNKCIWYIHGNANDGDELLLGHGKTEEQINDEVKKEMPTGLTEEERQIWIDENETDFSYDIALGETIKQVGKQRKDVENIMSSNKWLWKNLKDITDFYVYGLSYSSIDMPYLQKIISLIDKDNISFHLSYYSNKDKEKAAKIILSNKIPNNNVHYVKLEELQIKK